MTSNIKRSIQILSLVAILAGCSKQNGFGPNYDAYNGGAVPVTVTNATDYRPDPTVTTSLAGGGAIQIILAIPASSKHTIKEITKVAASSSYAAIQSTGSTGFYTTGPIAGGSTTVTFNTTIADYFVNKPVNATSNPAAKKDTELSFRFYFLLTLDDGTVIVTTPVRVFVLA